MRIEKDEIDEILDYPPLEGGIIKFMSKIVEFILFSTTLSIIISSHLNLSMEMSLKTTILSFELLIIFDWSKSVIKNIMKKRKNPEHNSGE